MSFSNQSQLKQFVPSSVCLQCEGCCRFQLAESPWRPKVGQQEVQEGVDQASFLKTIAQKDGHYHCVFFNKKNSTCGIYGHRPFECALYPFVLSKSQKGLELYVHLACPYIQEHHCSPDLNAHVDYLRMFFAQAQVKNFLQNNSRLLHDYTPYHQELEFLFSVEV